MVSIEYNLFRVKFVRNRQADLFDSTFSRSEVFLAAINEKPSAELRKGYLWHIGNVELFSPTTGYFAVGRTTSSTVEKFDEVSGNFIYEELEESPFTHCVFDSEIGLLAVAKKSSLGSDAKGIAAKIQQLVRSSAAVFQTQAIVEILPIPDPEGFLRMLAEAYRVTKFTATFRGPNPFDADEYFQKPLAKLLQASDGEKGQAQVQGRNLNRQVLAELTRSTAATGNEASARVVKTQSERPVTINLRGDPIKRVYDEKTHIPKSVLQQFVEIYRRMRAYANDPN